MTNKEQKIEYEKDFKIFLKELTFKERRIIELRYGLGKDKKSHTLKEISQMTGVTIGRIKSLENRNPRRRAAGYSDETSEYLS